MQRSAYLDYARRVFAESARAVSPLVFCDKSRHYVEEVVCILSSARSGSSFLFEALSRTGKFVALPAEHTPLYKLAGLGREDLGLTDEQISGDTCRRLDPRHLDQLFHYMALEFCCGPLARKVTRADILERMVRRLAIQWPSLALPHAELMRACAESFDQAVAQGVPQDVRATFLSAVASIGDRVGLNDLGLYYDVPNPERTERTAVLPPPNDHFLIEEPPFIVPARGRVRFERRAGVPCILLKASVDAFYFPVIAELFPQAEIKIVYLQRNPASAINGLMDGWVKGTFYSHNVGREVQLNVSGYSALSAHGRSWWKFELPPGWREAARWPLQNVCSIQWETANRSIISNLACRTSKTLSVKYEDLVRDDRSFTGTMRRILDFVGGKGSTATDVRLRDIPYCMATSGPRFFRWKDREREILEVVNQDSVSYLAKHLGYSSTTRHQDWI